MMEMLVALAILLCALLPLAYSLASEKRLARAAYQRAVAMEVVDGEMEVLAAGEWRAMPAGVHEHQVHAAALTNLPPGKFLLTIEAPKIRLEWQPAVPNHGPVVVREATIGKTETRTELSR